MSFTTQELELLRAEDMGDARYLSGDYDPGWHYDELPTSTTYFAHGGLIYQWGEFDGWEPMTYERAIALDLVCGPSVPPKVDTSQAIGKSKEKRGCTYRYWIVYPDTQGRPSEYEPVAKSRWDTLRLPEMSMGE